MNKPSRGQILAEKDPKRISEWIATCCYGWEKESRIYFGGVYDFWVRKGPPDIQAKSFNPLTDTVESRGQCFELMDEFNISVMSDRVMYDIQDKHYFVYFDKGEKQEAICKAALLRVCEVE